MARSRRRKLPDSVVVDIESLSHDGRGVAHIDGKVAFVDGALPGEQVLMRYVRSKAQYADGAVEQVLIAAEERREPGCSAYGVCGGCSLRHMKAEDQRTLKQQVLAEQFEHFGKVEPEQWLFPMAGPEDGYRHKGRLGIRHVEKKGRTLVGFREKQGHYIAQNEGCQVLIPQVGQRLPDLARTLSLLEARDRIPQIELAAGDNETALVVRHLDPLSDVDLKLLIEFVTSHEFTLYLQPKGPETVHRVWPEGEPRLHYRLQEFGIEFAFHPMDFIQVNPQINRQVVVQAVEMLQLNSQDKSLDLFCGLGNFTLPLAIRAGSVVGVEGSDEMVRRGTENALRNNLDNVSFFAANLFESLDNMSWVGHYDKLLLDPPRSGAERVVKEMSRFSPQRIVYVSCNPATLARDAGILVQEQGYRLLQAGIMKNAIFLAKRLYLHGNLIR